MFVVAKPAGQNCKQQVRTSGQKWTGRRRNGNMDTISFLEYKIKFNANMQKGKN